NHEIRLIELHVATALLGDNQLAFARDLSHGRMLLPVLLRGRRVVWSALVHQGSRKHNQPHFTVWKLGLRTLGTLGDRLTGLPIVAFRSAKADISLLGLRLGQILSCFRNQSDHMV